MDREMVRIKAEADGMLAYMGEDVPEWDGDCDYEKAVIKEWDELEWWLYHEHVVLWDSKIMTWVQVSNNLADRFARKEFDKHVYLRALWKVLQQMNRGIIGHGAGEV